MSVFTRLGRVLPKHRRTSHATPARGGDALVIEPKARTRQELAADLERNYADAVDLMRKVDRHLDLQERQSRDLMAVAERVEPAIGSLPQIRVQHEALADAVEALRETTARTGERSAEQRQTQIEALERVQRTLDASAEHEMQVAQTLGGFRDSVDGVAIAATDLGRVLRTMQDRDSKRDERLAELIGNNTKWMITLVCVCGVGLMLAVALAIVAMS